MHHILVEFFENNPTLAYVILGASMTLSIAVLVVANISEIKSIGVWVKKNLPPDDLKNEINAFLDWLRTWRLQVVAFQFIVVVMIGVMLDTSYVVLAVAGILAITPVLLMKAKKGPIESITSEYALGFFHGNEYEGQSSNFMRQLADN